MPRIGTVIDGKYEILREIGRGGMSIVYLAMDMRLNKQWAVKEIRKRDSGKNEEIVVNRLLAEAKLMKRLNHPALPRIVDIIDNGITIYVVMDYIEGESLDKILETHGMQSEETVILWAKQICEALAYLHEQNPPIIYRDMKPANVMLMPDGNIKIIDFGIAREYREQNLVDTVVLGTRGYAPPEQYSGQADRRSDIFALGMTMHHLLTGSDPRRGELYAPVRQWNPALSEGIERIIDKCVQPAAENRYQTCEELLYDLDSPSMASMTFKRRQKYHLAAFIASALLCMTGLISGFVFNQFCVFAVLGLVLSVFFWFRFKIPVVIGVLSGWTARKAIKQMRQYNESNADNSGKLSVSKRIPDNSEQIPFGQRQNDEETPPAQTGRSGLQHRRGDSAKAGLKMDPDTTAVWDDFGTEQFGAKKLILLEEVVIIHTKEHI